MSGHTIAPDLLTPRDVAERLRVSTKTVQRLTARGELLAIYPGRYPRYTEREVAAFVRTLEGHRRRRVA